MPVEFDQHPLCQYSPYVAQQMCKPDTTDQQEDQPVEHSFPRISLSIVDSILEGRLCLGRNCQGFRTWRLRRRSKHRLNDSLALSLEQPKRNRRIDERMY